MDAYYSCSCNGFVFLLCPERQSKKVFILWFCVGNSFHPTFFVLLRVFAFDIETNIRRTTFENRSIEIANERFAWLGGIAGRQGLSGIPPKLRKYYKDIFR